MKNKVVPVRVSKKSRTKENVIVYNQIVFAMRAAVQPQDFIFQSPKILSNRVKFDHIRSAIVKPFTRPI